MKDPTRHPHQHGFSIWQGGSIWSQEKRRAKGNQLQMIWGNGIVSDKLLARIITQNISFLIPGYTQWVYKKLVKQTELMCRKVRDAKEIKGSTGMGPKFCHVRHTMSDINSGGRLQKGNLPFLFVSFFLCPFAPSRIAQAMEFLVVQQTPLSVRIHTDSLYDILILTPSSSAVWVSESLRVEAPSMSKVGLIVNVR